MKTHHFFKSLSRTLFMTLIGVTLPLAFSLGSLSGCATPKDDAKETDPGAPFSSAHGQERVSIMTYNVENLFDTVHDEGKDDHTYLPLREKNRPEVRAACAKITNSFYRQECFETDWNEDVLNEKLHRIADVIQQVNGGRGPDIQILVEVENKNVLEMLRTQHLSRSGYKTLVLEEGPDNRGIDPAILSRFESWDEPKLHLIPFKTRTPEDEARANTTRGILEARLLLPDGQKLSVFALHFPSQSNPTYLRKQAIEYLNTLMKQLPPDVLAIAGGDFNVTSAEDKSYGYYKRILSGPWLVSHLVGCQQCQGSHYYHPNRDWSFLDVLAFAKSTNFDKANKTQWQLDPLSIRTPNQSRYQNNRHGSPERFNAKSSIGVSDHWPVYGEFFKSKSRLQ